MRGIWSRGGHNDLLQCHDSRVVPSIVFWMWLMWPLSRNVFCAIQYDECIIFFSLCAKVWGFTTVWSTCSVHADELHTGTNLHFWCSKIGHIDYNASTYSWLLVFWTYKISSTSGRHHGQRMLLLTPCVLNICEKNVRKMGKIFFTLISVHYYHQSFRNKLLTSNIKNNF